MLYVDFVRALELIEVYKSEDRLVLQSMLDNHLKINSKKKKSFIEIYEKFTKSINSEIKIENIDIVPTDNDIEEDKKNWDRVIKSFAK